MAGTTKVKKLKLDCKIINPDFTTKCSKTELYKDTAPSSGVGLSLGVDRPPLDSNLDVPVTSYYDRIHEENIAWERNRSELIEAYYDTCTPRDNEMCLHCSKKIDLQEEHMRCTDCAAHAYFFVWGVHRNDAQHQAAPFPQARGLEGR
ncbi:uncharacterized protein [Amphiura filiformis]|uniref:uncharacterized protein n=1 Tax=Amphiura filiformis TaxID=82378 RepID=UPI003B21CB24